jgi:hypothetical protein
MIATRLADKLGRAVASGMQLSLECNGKSGGVTNGSEMAPVRRAVHSKPGDDRG